VLEIRAVMFVEDGEVIWCDEPEADAFGVYVVGAENDLGWVADFADYGIGMAFAEKYADDNDLVFVDRVRSLISKIP